MNSKAKGEISEAMVIAAALQRGFSVSLPFGDNQRYDMIIDDGSKLVRVQVKTGRMLNGCITFATASKNGFTGKRSPYHGHVEEFLIYSPDTGKVYRVPVSECGSNESRLRVNPPRGGAASKIRWAADFEL